MRKQLADAEARCESVPRLEKELADLGRDKEALEQERDEVRGRVDSMLSSLQEIEALAAG